MARLPALIDALTELDTRDRATIGHIARLVREAGLIQTTKRGRGASEMSTADVIALLIAVNGSASPAETPHAVKEFRRMVQMRELMERTSPVPPAFALMDNAKTFTAALEVLLISVPEIGKFAAGIPFTLQVTFFLPVAAASIFVNWPSGSCDWYYRGRQDALKPKVDSAVSIRIGFRTFQALHNLLWP